MVTLCDDETGLVEEQVNGKTGKNRSKFPTKGLCSNFGKLQPSHARFSCPLHLKHATEILCDPPLEAFNRKLVRSDSIKVIFIDRKMTTSLGLFDYFEHLDLTSWGCGNSG